MLKNKTASRAVAVTPVRVAATLAPALTPIPVITKAASPRPRRLLLQLRGEQLAQQLALELLLHLL